MSSQKLLMPKSSSLRKDAAESKIYFRQVRGVYQRLRFYIPLPLMLVFFLVPWFQIDGRQALILDLGAQKFHVLWMTFWPQDGMLLTWVLIIAATGLFAITAYAGRVWCGFACPQSVWTNLFMWLERVCEGDRQQRIKLDSQTWNTDKLLRKTSKHLLWLGVALLSSLTFVSYFYGARELVLDTLNFQLSLESIFWIFLFTSLTYINAGVMREQFCNIACPYSRFQSVMYDSDTKTVSYDANRGDTLIDPTTGKVANKNLIKTIDISDQPINDSHFQIKRLPRNPKVDHKTKGLGDCVDCEWCVQVCPVGIDIRDGLQAECISCGLCIDACDSVMDHMGYDRGLIRFASLKQLQKLNSSMTESKKFPLFNSRALAYGLITFVMCIIFTADLLKQKPFDVNIQRERGSSLYRVYNEHVENIYWLGLRNMSDTAHRYQVAVPQPFTLKGQSQITLEAGEIFKMPVTVKIPRQQVSNTKQELVFKISSVIDPSFSIEEISTFIAPNKG